MTVSHSDTFGAPPAAPEAPRRAAPCPLPAARLGILGFHAFCTMLMTGRESYRNGVRPFAAGPVSNVAQRKGGKLAKAKRSRMFARRWGHHSQAVSA
jgi:hypothetical protein